MSTVKIKWVLGKKKEENQKHLFWFHLDSPPTLSFLFARWRSDIEGDTLPTLFNSYSLTSKSASAVGSEVKGSKRPNAPKFPVLSSSEVQKGSENVGAMSCWSRSLRRAHFYWLFTHCFSLLYYDVLQFIYSVKRDDAFISREKRNICIWKKNCASFSEITLTPSIRISLQHDSLR